MKLRFVLLLACLVLLTSGCSLANAADNTAWQDLLHLAHNVSIQARGNPDRLLQGQDSAIALAHRALAALDTGTPEDHNARAMILNRMADFCLLRHDYVRADSILKASLRETAVAGADETTRARTFDRLGLLHAHYECPADTSTVTRLALAKRDSLLHSTNAHDIPALDRLADVDGLLDELEEFYTIHHKIVSLWRPGSPTNARFVIRSLIYFGEAYSKPTVSNVGKSSTLQDSAVIVGDEALRIAEEELGPADTMVSFSATRLGDYYSRLGNLAKAQSLWEQAWQINRVAFPPEHIEYQGSIYRMAGIYRRIGEYGEAERLYRECVRLRELTQGPGHPEVAGMFTSLGRLLQTLGRYDEAESCYLHALHICQAAVEHVDSDIATLKRLLSSLYLESGRYADAEQNVREAIRLDETGNIRDTSQLAASLVDLANIYQSWNRLPDAEDCLLRALSLQETFLHPDHPNLAPTLITLADLLISRGEIVRGRLLLERGFDILQPVSSYAGATIARCHAVAAEADRRAGDLNGAIAHADSAVQRLTEVYGADDFRMIPALVTLADMEGENSDPGSMKAALQRAEHCAQAIHGTHHPYAAMLLEAEADYLAGVNSLDSAIDCSSRAFAIRLQNLKDAAVVMTESDALAAASRVHADRDDLVREALRGNVRTECDDRVATAMLNSKSLVRDLLLTRQRNLLTHAGTQPLRDTLRTARARLSRLYKDAVRLPDERGIADELFAVEAQIDSIEARLALASHVPDEVELGSLVDVADIRRALPSDAVLVEYAQCSFTNGPHYTALVVRPRQSARLVDLGPVGPVDSIVGLYQMHFVDLGNRSYLPTQRDRDDYNRLIRQVQARIWDPIDPAFEDDRTIFVSPDGSLNTLAWAAFVEPDDSYLIEHNPIHYLNSGRDLVRVPAARTGTGLLAVGDPDYDAAPVEQSQFAATSDEGQPSPPFVSEQWRRSLKPCARSESAALTRLPGTRKEVTAIAELWKRKYDGPATLCIGAAASEGTISQSSHGCRVVHIATHGYYETEECRELTFADRAGKRQAANISPLLFSGLCLAGIQRPVMDEAKASLDDGLLTAAEISGLDLSGTRLVVLSACETALGPVAANEGVFGLQRAFQLAGAATVVSTLWSVADQFTVPLVEHMYEELDQTMPVMLRDAQLTMINDRRTQGRSEHPYLWAGFIATGDWRAPASSR